MVIIMTNIYGIDSKDKITPPMVRDAIIECFYQAHCSDTGLEGSEEFNNDYCKTIVENAFEKTNGDFKNPTKETIAKVIDHLAEFSKSFRSKDIIEKHFTQIKILFNKLA